MSVITKIPCPDCGQQIPVDSVMLISGASFQCPNRDCLLLLSLDMQQAPLVQDAFFKFEALRNDARALQDQHVLSDAP